MVSRRNVISGVIGLGIGSVGAGSFAYNAGKNRGIEKGYRDGVESVQSRIEENRAPTSNDKRIINHEFDGDVAADDYHSVTIESQRSILLIATVVADYHVDIVCIKEKGWADYQNKDEADYNVLASELDTTETVIRRVVDSGKYHMTLDNTRMGRAVPNGPVGAYMTVEAYVNPQEDTES